ncbi:unnamed protein product [Rotaria sp. Silwood2]|nr:unnamed protein product [Rotaria sp. Silwood2]
MSSITYNNTNNQIPTAPPPPQPIYRMNRSRSRSDFIFDRRNNFYQNKRLNHFNQFNYQNYYSQNRRFYRPRFYYNRSYQPMQYIPQQVPIRRRSQNRPINRSNLKQIRSQSRQTRQSQRRLRHLPPDFNLESNINNAPPDALPQRAVFVNNTTQPFVVNNPTTTNQQQQSATTNSNQQERTTSSALRRQQQRNRQQQQQQNCQTRNNNRFALLADNDEDTTDIESNIDNHEPTVVTTDNSNNKKNMKNLKDKKKNKIYAYLQNNKVLAWFKNDEVLGEIIKARGNQAYVLATTSFYDEWVRQNYQLQGWQQYLKLGTERKHWAKDVIRRTKKRDDIESTRFAQKKINQITSTIVQICASISDLQIQLATYWSQVPKRTAKRNDINNQATTQTPILDTNTNAQPVTTDETAPTPTPTLTPERVRSETHRLEEGILKYIQNCTQHVKKSAENRIKLAKVQMDEFKALEDFEQIATPAQWNLHLILKPKMKSLSTKNQNVLLATKRVEYDLLPKFIEKVDLSFKVDESIVNSEEVQGIHNQMREITKDFRIKAMTLYTQSLVREQELLTKEIDRIIEGFPQENDDGFDAEIGIINQANIQLSEEEHELLRLGPRFIFDDPKTASRRRTTELATLKRKIETRFLEKGINLGRPVEQFIDELDVLLQKLHNIPISKQNKNINPNNPNHNLNYTNINTVIQSQLSQSQNTIRNLSKNSFKKKNYHRLIKRLKYRMKIANTVLRKSDKSKVFHLGESEEYKKKSDEYMEKTQAYKCLGKEDSLPDLIQRTNKYLLDLRLAKWITQKQYEQLCINTNEVELAHLYYLPKAHKPGTPLRPIVSGLKHPTVKISKFLDDLLRPLFDKIAAETTVNSGFELIKQLQEWSRNNLKQETLFCTIDVADLYTMVPQTEGVLSLKKMLDYLNIKQVGGLKIETIIRLSRFVMKNNYFSYNSQYYHQIRGGAMGSPLTLTISNCYMFFFERKIANQIYNSNGLYFRYIDDLFITINWSIRHLVKQIEQWNKFDENIKLSENIGLTVDFLDLHIENQGGVLFTSIFQKPSYEPYYLPFNSIHPFHMKKNIIHTMLLRAIRYCSSFQAYVDERERLKMALLLNKYPNKFIEEQFQNNLLKWNIDQPLSFNNYNENRQKVITTPIKEKALIDYERTIFIHFTYCSSMKLFPRQFHILWNKYFHESPINEIQPILGTRNVNNLQRRLIHTKS